MRRMRFDAAKAGYVIEWKGEQYVKLQKEVKITSMLRWNAVTASGALFNFFPYEEITEIGPFTKEKSYVASKR